MQFTLKEIRDNIHYLTELLEKSSVQKSYMNGLFNIEEMEELSVFIQHNLNLTLEQLLRGSSSDNMRTRFLKSSEELLNPISKNEIPFGNSNMHIEVISPSQFKNKKYEAIEYGTCMTSLGLVFMLFNQEHLIALDYCDTDYLELLNQYKNKYLGKQWIENNEKIVRCAQTVFSLEESSLSCLKLLLVGTPFQLAVWKTLLSIPRGKVVSYSFIATAICNPKSVRAVGTAVGSNPVSVLVPCHRVLRNDGTIGQYHWGVGRKALLLAQEVNI